MIRQIKSRKSLESAAFYAPYIPLQVLKAPEIKEYDDAPWTFGLLQDIGHLVTVDHIDRKLSQRCSDALEWARANTPDFSIVEEQHRDWYLRIQFHSEGQATLFKLFWV